MMMFNTITSVDVVIKPYTKSVLIRLNLLFIFKRMTFLKSKAPVKTNIELLLNKKLINSRVKFAINSIPNNT